MEKRVKAREDLQIGRCDVIYQSHTGIEKVYKDVAVCDVEIKKRRIYASCIFYNSAGFKNYRLYAIRQREIGGFII